MMVLKISVGVTKKMGLPNYGSLGANCHLEIELDQPPPAEPEALQRRIRQAYAICREAVAAELACAGTRNGNGSGGGPNINGRRARADESDNGAESSSRATAKQLSFARQLAGQIQRIGIRRLDQFAVRLCARPLADLSAADASRLIDALKAIKEGSIDIESALAHATSG